MGGDRVFLLRLRLSLLRLWSQVLEVISDPSFPGLDDSKESMKSTGRWDCVLGHLRRGPRKDSLWGQVRGEG